MHGYVNVKFTENCPAATVIVHIILCLWLHYWYASNSFQVGLFHWQILKANSIVWKSQMIIFKGTTAFGIPKSMCCSYSASFQWMVLEHVEERYKCATEWVFRVAVQNVWRVLFFRDDTLQLCKWTDSNLRWGCYTSLDNKCSQNFQTGSFQSCLSVFMKMEILPCNVCSCWWCHLTFALWSD